MSSYDSWLAPHEKPEARIADAIERSSKRTARAIKSAATITARECRMAERESILEYGSAYASVQDEPTRSIMRDFLGTIEEGAHDVG